MDAESLRAELLDLDAERKKIEEKATSLRNYLTAPGMPGLKGNLDDAEGFPRADIDIPNILQARHDLACLNTDHEALMNTLERKLQQYHTALRENDKQEQQE